jgi:hypothetical protein
MGGIFERFTPTGGRVLIGLFLILAFAVTSAVLLFVLTAEQLQGSIASPDIASFKPTVGSIRQYVAELDHYYSIDAYVVDKQKTIGNQLLQRNADEEAALAQMATAADNVRTFVNASNTLYIHPPLVAKPFITRPPPAQQQAAQPAPNASATPAPASDTAVAAPDTSASPPASDTSAPPSGAQIKQRSRRTTVRPMPVSLGLQDALAAYFTDYYQQAAALKGEDAQKADKAIDAFKDQVFKHYQVYAAARAKYDAAESEVTSLQAQNDALEAQENDYYNEIITPPSPLATDAYWNLCEDFLSFKSLVGDWAYNIVLFPKMMLVLMLAIFMGILGSLIYISQDFLKNPEGRDFWDILFRIGLGAGVAFALFFFAAAGMLALSQNAAGAQQDMSPYLISFLGITGGYLSDRVTQWMREVGENTFKVEAGGPPKRWAMGLADALKAANLDTAALASVTDVTPSEVGDWVTLAKPVPGDKQALVAAYLRLHPSRLFTDIAPG